MGMGPVSGAFQNGANNVQSGMGGKGKGGAQQQYQPPTQNPYVPFSQPQGGFGGKGGQMQPYQQTPSWAQQGGMGGKGKGGGQPQQPQVQQPIQQTPYQQPQQNPYAQSYYQPQFRPQTFNNPYAQSGFGQQPQMGGFGGKGGQIQQFINQQPQPQGGYGMKGGHRGWEGRRQQNMNPNPQYNMPQNQGLAGLTPAQALTQPTATTQALTPEQPYMGNYLQ